MDRSESPSLCARWSGTVVTLLVALCATPLGAHPLDGPLQVRNQFPVHLTAMPPYLESAEPRDSAFAGLSHSSVYVIETLQPWVVNLDLEQTEFDLRLKKKVRETTEIGFELPVLRPSGGFFDHSLDEWHSMLGVGDYGRSARPYNAFLYEVTLNNAPVLRGVNDRTGMGDLRITAKQVIRREAPIVSLMAGVEVPTGDAKAGYGNGSYDASASLLADFRFSEKYLGTMNAGVTFPGAYRGYQTVGLRTFWHAGVAFEAAWWDRFSVVLQTLAQTSPLAETGIRQFDWPGVLVTIGGRYYGTKGNMEFSLTEDLDTAGAPDFIASVGYAVRF